MTREKLLATLEAHKDDSYHFTGSCDYHEAKEIVSIVQEVLTNYGDQKEEISDIDDLRDEIDEQADSYTPVYNHELLAWLTDNYSAYEEIVDEIGEAKGSDGKTDLMRGIMQAYCLTLERESFEALSQIWEEAKESEIV